MNNNTFGMDRLFPSTVIYKNFTIANHSQIVDLSKQLVTKYDDRPFYSPCRSTVKTKSDILEMPEFLDIQDQIMTVISAYVVEHKIDIGRLKLTDSWINYYDIHGYQDLHHHPGSVLSGVYYIKSAGLRDFSFQAPWHFHQGVFPDYLERSFENSHNIEYESIEGRCMVWMSHLMHRTYPATQERISISFNVTYS
jgi:uncharacterized protein (TIGR02466 family)